MRRFNAWVFGAAAIAFCIFVGGPVAASPNNPASFSAKVSPDPLRPGEIATVQVIAKIDPGWHLYGLQQVPAPGPYSTTITVSGNGLQAAGATVENAPTRAFDDNFGKEVTFHLLRAVFDIPVRVLPSPAGSRTASILIGYQTCNSSVCLPPTTKLLSAQVDVQPGAVRPEYSEPPKTTTPEGSLFWFLSAAFGAGLLALFTPCVFPLIPITLSSFVKQADGNKKRLVQLASGYSFGIIILYVAVGVLTTLILGASGISRLATNPWVNLFAFAVFLIFALSFFETIRLEVPGNLGSLQLAARKQGGLIGLISLGTVFVLASFTCTAPFVGTLLVTAAGGSLVRPMLGMLVFASAFVSPFLLFSFFPQWITKVPKSGVWLARVKATLGFVEIAASLKFLSNVDLVWQWHILTEPVLLSAWALIFFCTALYLLDLLRFGVVAETEPAGAKVTLARGVFASFFIAGAIYCFWGLSGRPLSPYVAAYLPPDGYGSTAGSAVTTGLPWMSDYGAALMVAKDESKPLLIDFTGYTCTNCRLNEKRVFPAAIVQRELANFVLVQLYTDGGPNATKNENLQISKFGDAALPLYAIEDPNSQSVIATTAGVQSVAGFADFLRRNGNAVDASSSAWQPYSASAVRAAIAAQKPSIIDFTARWCTNCKAIERTVFTDPSITSQLPLFATYRSDLTNFTSPASVLLEQKYSIASLPAIVFLDKSGTEVPGSRVTGLVSVAEFAAKMAKASQ